MNDVSANLPVVTPSVMPETNNMTEIQQSETNMQSVPAEIQNNTLSPTDTPQLPADGLERTPDADSVELKSLVDPQLGAVKMPSPKQVEEGLSVATKILLGMKAVVEAAGGLWDSIKDNFQNNKKEEIAKRAQKAANTEQATKLDAAA